MTKDRGSALARAKVGAARSRRRYLAAAIAIALIHLFASGPALAAEAGARADTTSTERSKAEAIHSYLKHVYSVYLGLRACTELSTEQNDRSFLPSVPLDEARRTLRSIDAAALEVRIDTNEAWAAAAPQAEVTAEALKVEAFGHVEQCHQLGRLFRIDVSNLQALLQSLGAKTTLITKDY